MLSFDELRLKLFLSFNFGQVSACRCGVSSCPPRQTSPQLAILLRAALPCACTPVVTVCFSPLLELSLAHFLRDALRASHD